MFVWIANEGWGEIDGMGWDGPDGPDGRDEEAVEEGMETTNMENHKAMRSNLLLSRSHELLPILRRVRIDTLGDATPSGDVFRCANRRVEFREDGVVGLV